MTVVRPSTADFACARLSDALGDPELKKEAVRRITACADHAIALSPRNASDVIAGMCTDFPLIFCGRYSSTSGQSGFLPIYGPFKKMIPNWYDWPVNEQYIDFATLALRNENCFFQTSVPAACYWFWLHTRQSR